MRTKEMKKIAESLGAIYIVNFRKNIIRNIYQKHILFCLKGKPIKKQISQFWLVEQICRLYNAINKNKDINVCYGFSIKINYAFDTS